MLTLPKAPQKVPHVSAHIVPHVSAHIVPHVSAHIVPHVSAHIALAYGTMHVKKDEGRFWHNARISCLGQDAGFYIFTTHIQVCQHVHVYTQRTDHLHVCVPT